MSFYHRDAIAYMAQYLFLDYYKWFVFVLLQNVAWTSRKNHKCVSDILHSFSTTTKNMTCGALLCVVHISAPRIHTTFLNFYYSVIIILYLGITLYEKVHKHTVIHILYDISYYVWYEWDVFLYLRLLCSPSHTQTPEKRIIFYCATIEI